jgi:signal peptide peptidase SppA
MAWRKQKMPKKHSIRHIIESVYATPWAITESKFNEILAVLDRRDRGLLSEEELKVFGEPLEDPEDDQGYCLTPGGVAVINVSGVIAQRMNLIMRFSGGVSSEMLGRTIQKCLKNPECKALVLDINSPGGTVGGTAECSDLIYNARGTKPMIAVSNTCMASGAYWIGSACDEVVASPSSRIGSIGVYMVHAERSKQDAEMGVKRTVISAGRYKTAGNDVEPLSEESRGKLQQFVNDAYAMFTEAVARNRKASVQAVRNGFGEGDAPYSREAVAEKLADRVATLDQVISELEARFRAAPGGGLSAQKTLSPIGDKPSITQSFLKGKNMDKKLIAALFAKGLIADCTEEAAQAFFATRNETIPTDAAAYVKTLLGETQQLAKYVGELKTESTAIDYDKLAAKIDERAAARAQKEADYLKTQTTAVCELMGLDAQASAEIVALGLPLEKVREVVREKVAGVSNPLPRIEIKSTDLDSFAKGAQEALDAKCLTAAGINLSEKEQPKNNPFMRMRASELAERNLRILGVRTEGMTRNEICKLALSMDNPAMLANAGGSAYYGTSSFPNLTLNSMRKVLARAYDEATVTWTKWARRGESVPDFKTFSIVKFGEANDLEEIPEGHETPIGTGLTDGREYSAVGKFEKTDPFTWEMMVNDDLSALSRLPKMNSNAAARTVNKKVYVVLTGNPTMADGYSVFDATNHQGNLLGTGSTTAAPPSVTTLSAMQAKLRTMKGLNTDATLNVALRWLIHPAALETTATTLLRSQTDPANANPNVRNQFYGSVEPVCEPLLDSVSTAVWYGAADNGQIDTVEVVFLQGQETPFVESWWDPKFGTRYYKTQQCFAALPVDYRGLIKHTGYSA